MRLHLQSFSTSFKRPERHNNRRRSITLTVWEEHRSWRHFTAVSLNSAGTSTKALKSPVFWSLTQICRAQVLRIRIPICRSPTTAWNCTRPQIRYTRSLKRNSDRQNDWCPHPRLVVCSISSFCLVLRFRLKK